MGRNIESRISSLEESSPRGFRTFDSKGRVLIDSPLTAVAWYAWAGQLLTEPGNEIAKEELATQLAYSVRMEGGGLLHEYAFAMLCPPLFGPQQPPDSAPERQRKR